MDGRRDGIRLRPRLPSEAVCVSAEDQTFPPRMPVPAFLTVAVLRARDLGMNALAVEVTPGQAWVLICSRPKETPAG